MLTRHFAVDAYHLLRGWAPNVYLRRCRWTPEVPKLALHAWQSRWQILPYAYRLVHVHRAKFSPKSYNIWNLCKKPKVRRLDMVRKMLYIRPIALSYTPRVRFCLGHCPIPSVVRKFNSASVLNVSWYRLHSEHYVACGVTRWQYTAQRAVFLDAYARDGIVPETETPALWL